MVFSNTATVRMPGGQKKELVAYKMNPGMFMTSNVSASALNANYAQSTGSNFNNNNKVRDTAIKDAMNQMNINNKTVLNNQGAGSTNAGYLGMSGGSGNTADLTMGIDSNSRNPTWMTDSRRSVNRFAGQAGAVITKADPLALKLSKKTGQPVYFKNPGTGTGIPLGVTNTKAYCQNQASEYVSPENVYIEGNACVLGTPEGARNIVGNQPGQSMINLNIWIEILKKGFKTLEEALHIRDNVIGMEGAGLYPYHDPVTQKYYLLGQTANTSVKNPQWIAKNPYDQTDGFGGVNYMGTGPLPTTAAINLSGPVPATAGSVLEGVGTVASVSGSLDSVSNQYQNLSGFPTEAQLAAAGQ